MKSLEQPLRLRNREPENRWAIGLMWNLIRSHRHQFRKSVERGLMPPPERTSHDVMRIAAVLPFDYRPLDVRVEGGHILRFPGG